MSAPAVAVAPVGSAVDDICHLTCCDNVHALCGELCSHEAGEDDPVCVVCEDLDALEVPCVNPHCEFRDP